MRRSPLPSNSLLTFLHKLVHEFLANLASTSVDGYLVVTHLQCEATTAADVSATKSQHVTEQKVRQPARTHLSIDVLHELDEEINHFVFPHGVQVLVRNQERNIVVLRGLALQHDEVFGAHHQKARELACQHHVKLIHLLDFHAESQGVDTRLDEAPLAVIPANLDGIQKKLLVAATKQGIPATSSADNDKRKFVETAGAGDW